MLQGATVICVLTGDHTSASIGPALAEAGWKPLRLGSVQEGYEAIRAGGVDAAILELEADGGLHATLPWLCAQDCARLLPVLALTSDASTETRLAALAAGVNDCLTLPLDPHELRLRLRHAIQSVGARRLLEARNEELRRFAHVIAHDIRSPLAALRLYLGLARTAAAVRREELFERAMTVVGRIGAMLDGYVALVDVPQIRSYEEIDFGRLAAEVADQVHRPEAPLNLAITGDLSPVAGDPVLLRQVLVNLLDNAVRHRRSGSSCNVVIRPDPGRPGCILVEDDGVGIPAPEREAVFRAFTRGAAASAGSGKGLGLAIVRQIVELHGGKVWAEESIAGGARIVLDFGRYDQGSR